MKQYGQTEIVVPAVGRIVVACESGDTLPIAGLEGMFFYHRGMKSLFFYVDQWYKIPFGDGNLINSIRSLNYVAELDDSCSLSSDIGGTYLITGNNHDIIISLPPVTISLGVTYIIKSMGPTFIISGASEFENIDGKETQTVGVWETITVQSTRAGWHIINWYIPKSSWS
jgi:hypothetical protein